MVLLGALAPPAIAAEPRDNGRCRLPTDATVELRTPSAVLYSRSSFSDDGGEQVRVAGCLKSIGRRVLLAGFGDEFDSRGRLARRVATGRFAPWRSSTAGAEAASSP